MSHDHSAIASVLRPPRSGKSEVRALPWVLVCALSSLLYALPSYAQEPAPTSPDAGAPDAPAESAPTAAPPPPGPPATPVAEPAPGTPVAGPAPGSEPAARTGASKDDAEIQVTTSRRRVEAVQETPVAVTVVGSRQLNGAEGAKIHNAEDLSGTVPSFTIQNQPVSAGFVALSIRGISFSDIEKSWDLPIGIVIDGVYVASNSGINFQNFDLQSVEVLRGPQGTLFGRNTTGGLLNVRTVLPDTEEWHSKLLARVGSFGQYDLMGSVNAPIVPDYVGLKLSGSWTNLSGWYTNISQEFNPASSRSGAEPASHNLDGVADLLVTPTKSLSARLKYEHLQMRGTYGGISLFPDPTVKICNEPQTVQSPIPGVGQVPAFTFGTPPNSPRYCSTTINKAIGQTTTLGPYDSILGWGHNANDSDFNMLTGEVNYDLSSRYKIVAVTGWRHSYEYLEAETDAIPQTFLDVTRTYHTDQLSEEVRLHGNPLPTVNFVVGGLLWHSFYDYRSPVENLLQNPGITGGAALPPGVVLLTKTSQDTTSAAGFGQAEWEFVKNTRLTAGARYTWEEKEFHWATGITPNADSDAFAAPPSPLAAQTATANPPAQSWANVSPRAGLDYKLGPSVMGTENAGLLYGVWSRGFHSGAYNERASTLREIGPFKPEYIDNFEVGVKTSWARNRLILNVDGFYMLFQNKQEFIPQAAPAGSLNPVLTLPENAATATIKGIEYEIQAMPLRGHDVPLVANLRLWTTGSIIDARYNDFAASFGVNAMNMPNPPANFAGTPLILAPDFQAAVGATIPFELTPTSRFIVDGQLRYRTEMAMCFATDPTGQVRNPLCNVPAASRVDASVSYVKDEIVSSLSGRITVYARNLTDQVTFGALGPEPGIGWIASYMPPRSFGVEAALNF